MSVARGAITLQWVSPISMSLVRRWPEGRPVVLGSAAVGFAALLFAGDPALAALYVLPVALAALEVGLGGGGVMGGVAGAAALAGGGVAPAVAAVAVGLIAGRPAPSRGRRRRLPLQRIRERGFRSPSDRRVICGFLRTGSRVSPRTNCVPSAADWLHQQSDGIH